MFKLAIAILLIANISAAADFAVEKSSGTKVQIRKTVRISSSTYTQEFREVDSDEEMERILKEEERLTERIQFIEEQIQKLRKLRQDIKNESERVR